MEALSKAYRNSAQLVSAVAGSVALILFFFSEPLLFLWTQDRMIATNVAPILGLLALGNMLNGIMLVPYQVQLAYGWTSLSIRLNIGLIVLLLPILYIVVPIYGGIGAGSVWVCLNLIYIIVGANLMYQKIIKEEKRAWYLYSVIQPTLLGCLVIGLVKFLIPYPSAIPFQIIYFFGTFITLLSVLIFASPDLKSSILRMAR